jgi:hypothetical protein
MYRCEFRQECIKRVGQLISNEVRYAIDTQYRAVYQVNAERRVHLLDFKSER